MKAKIMACLLTAAVFLLMGTFSVHVNAQGEIPALPHEFYGSVTINGSPAPVGTEIEARGNGVETAILGNPITTTEEGLYGSADPLEQRLLAQGNIIDGATLTFYVNGVACNQTAIWHSGETTRLDLTVTIIPPAVTTEAATAISVSGATLNGNLTSLGSDPSVEVSFEWGTSTSYGYETVMQTMNSTGTFSFVLSGLSANTAYHFRAKAVGGGITSYGTDRSFTTQQPSPPSVGDGWAPVDTSPPIISDVSIDPEDITETSVKICWTTNEASTGYVEYWYIICSQESDRALSSVTEKGKEHCVQLTGLIPGTTYHYRVISKDASGNERVSDEYTFTTQGEFPGDFTVSQLKISPAEVDIGEEVTISVLVTNASNLATYTVNLKINGVVEGTQDVEIACSSKTITFTTQKDEPGSYSVSVDALSGSFKVREKVAPPTGEPSFKVSRLSISPAEVDIGEEVSISVLVTNDGTVTGTYTVTLKIDGMVEGTQDVTLDAGASKTITFTTQKDEPGSYSVSVDALSGSFKVREKVAPPVKPVNWPLIGGIIGGVILLGLLVYFFVVRRKRRAV